ncbi:MAG: hypothetical protein EOO13_18090 [Chitinophagaceae bacterium]|nr:MAG: hypothetical protein EOO13_18090 [Chitinophagaceae bacterium]
MMTNRSRFTHLPYCPEMPASIGLALIPATFRPDAKRQSFGDTGATPSRYVCFLQPFITLNKSPIDFFKN